MGIKKEELKNGCFARAMEDEPMFVLLARDASAPDLAREWARRREFAIDNGDKPEEDRVVVAEARACADAMVQWRQDNDGSWRE